MPLVILSLMLAAFHALGASMTCDTTLYTVDKL